MRKSFILAAALSLTMAGLAHAEQAPITLTGDVHAASQFNYRGTQFSNGEPSIGASVTAAHSSGVYGSLTSDTLKLTDLSAGFPGKSSRQFLNVLTVGYSTSLPSDVSFNAGVTRNVFTGGNVADLSSTELFGKASWNGAYAKVSYTLDGSRSGVPGTATGDVYTELGYTYAIGQYKVGADVGYALYDSRNAGTSDGIKTAQLRAGYDLNKNVSFSLSHQLNVGEGPYGEKSTGNHATTLAVAYTF